MTTYGLDIAKYQDGLDLSTARSQGFAFCMAKCTEGISEVDRTYARFRDQAKASGLMFSAYHFLTTNANPTDQAHFCVNNLGDKSIPIMLDVEKEGNSIPQLSHVKEFISAAHNAGGRVSLCYIPEWYWRDYMGSPSLKGLPAIVQSSYVNGTGFASAIYPGDNSNHWAGFGGIGPTLLQYSSSGKYSGYRGTIDVNAFKGTEAQLSEMDLFKEWDVNLDAETIQAIADRVIAQFYLDVRRGPNYPLPDGQSGNNKELRRIVREEVQALLPPATH